MSPTSPVILRPGGSLLALPDLRDRLDRLLSARQIARPLLVVGGGGTADLVREMQQRLRFDDRAAHRLAIAAMETNARLLVRLWPDAVLVSSRGAAVEAWRNRRLPIVNPTAFLTAEESCMRDELQNAAGETDRESDWSSRVLPATWEVTSDSIAAWIARRWPATELLLLKSCDPSGNSPACWAAAGQVDRLLPEIAGRHLPVTMMNLRK